MQISLIMTVFNEAATIKTVLQTLAAQSRRPDEVVIVDGGSQDTTLANIQQWLEQNPAVLNLKLLVQHGANISQGRNLAIAHATYPIIAVTDAGVRLEPNWLEVLTTPFERIEVAVVAGFFQADPHSSSLWEIALGATTLPTVSEIQPAKFLPSSRSVAFLQNAWQTADGYPEWLDYCEDLIFDLNLKKSGYSFEWCPAALAYFRPRSSPTAFFKQYYRYARGDGKANLFLKRHLLRYVTYTVVAPLMVWLGRKRWWIWPMLVGSGLFYVRTPYRRLFAHTPTYQKLGLTSKIAAILWIPLVRAIGDIAKMCGYPPGVWWRWFYIH